MPETNVQAGGAVVYIGLRQERGTQFWTKYSPSPVGVLVCRARSLLVRYIRSGASLHWSRRQGSTLVLSREEERKKRERHFGLYFATPR